MKQYTLFALLLAFITTGCSVEDGIDCVTGATRCDNGIVSECNADHLWKNTQTKCENRPCTSGEANHCSENNSGYYQCNTNNTTSYWELINCETDHICSNSNKKCVINNCLNNTDCKAILINKESPIVVGYTPISIKIFYEQNNKAIAGTALYASSSDESCFKIKNNNNFVSTTNGQNLEIMRASDINCDAMLTITDNNGTHTQIDVLVTADINQNLMYDYFEKAPKQGQNCRKSSDCDSYEGAGDGFCDSVLDFKCSTKCTSDDQCTSIDYYCREDGRCASKYFEFTIKINSQSTTFPIIPPCNFNIDWGDNSNETITDCSSKEIQHTYSEKGTYTVKISENEPNHIKWIQSDYNHPLNIDIIKITSYGPAIFGPYAFDAADISYNDKPIDIPNAIQLTDLSGLFAHSHSQPDITKWDTSHVINMSEMFNSASAFNQPIGNWDTSNVTDMSLMFLDATVFAQDISQWNTSKVTDMSWMFAATEQFNQPIGNWDTTSVTNMNDMFHKACFDQDLSNWNLKSMIMDKNGRTYNLLNIFALSSISKENYCKLFKGKSAAVWTAQQTNHPGSLGREFNCE